MSAKLSRLSKLAIGPETTPGTYAMPTMGLPVTKGDVTDDIGQIKDESWRANDTMLQGLYQGPADSSWSLELLAYPDLLGLFLAGIVGPDVVSAGVSTTLSASTIAGATSISTAVSIPAGTTIQIDTADGVEYAITGTPTGSGPYTIPITAPVGGLAKAHASGAAVASQSTHTFKQNPTAPRRRYSISLDDLVSGPQGYSYAAISDFQIKIDPKAAVSLSVKLTSGPALPQASFEPTYTPDAPILGWAWTMSNAGASSTRGLTFDCTVKRDAEAIHSSNGTQGPREVFQGALEMDFNYKAIYEDQTDLQLYLQALQQPATATVQQPLAAGGSSVAITMSKSGWSKGDRDLSGSYLEASFSGSGIYNATDGGALSVVLKNFNPAVY